MKLPSKQIRVFQKTVLNYYRGRGRRLPWRETRDPYKILVSEIMLQQTQVSRVIPFYRRFIRSFPSARALAGAPARTVLRLWQGLGYNRRALHLQHAAEAIVREHGGVVPHDIDKLDALPGFGPATAAAILAYAWDEPVALIETNIRTAFIHHFFPRRKKVHDKEILELVRQTLPEHTNILQNVGMSTRVWYAALMDYGTHLKETSGNAARQSAHYTRQTRFKGSVRELRGEIVKQVLQKGKVCAADFAAFAKRRLPVGNTLRALGAEGFLQKRGASFAIR